jgi:hypothetical protein
MKRKAFKYCAGKEDAGANFLRVFGVFAAAAKVCWHGEQALRILKT